MDTISPDIDASRRSDLTGRARIRDAALALFAERGFEAATLRDIAHLAGLSAGLVRRHFGSKDGLRGACDAYALERVLVVKEQGVRGGQLADPGFLAEVHPELLVLHQYLARSIIDGSPAADALLGRMLASSERWIAMNHVDDIADVRAVACLLAAAQIGVLMLRHQISIALDADIYSPEGHLRLGHALIEFYSTPLLSSDLAAQAHAALGHLPESPPSTSRAKSARTHATTKPQGPSVRRSQIQAKPPSGSPRTQKGIRQAPHVSKARGARSL